MSVAGAVMSGVSAVGGAIGASSKASTQRKQIDEQTRIMQTQQMINRAASATQRQTLELNNQRQQQLLAQEQAIALANNDLATQQASLQNTQAQIEQDRANVLNQQRVFQRKASANQQATQVAQQLTQQSKQQQEQYTQASAQQADQEAAMTGSKTTGSGVSKEAAAERLMLAVENGQIDAQLLYDENIQRELAQLGYEYNVADIEKRLGQVGLDYQQRDLGRNAELTGIQSSANRNNINTQTQRNNSAMSYELATNRSALSQAEASNELNTTAQLSSLEYQKKLSKGPSVFDWATTLGSAGLNVYEATVAAKNNGKKKEPYRFSNTQSINVGAGAPSYIPISDPEPPQFTSPGSSSTALGSGVDNSSYKVRPGSTPLPPYYTDMVFTRPEAYNTGRQLTTSIFRRR